MKNRSGCRPGPWCSGRPAARPWTMKPTCRCRRRCRSGAGRRRRPSPSNGVGARPARRVACARRRARRRTGAAPRRVVAVRAVVVDDRRGHLRLHDRDRARVARDRLARRVVEHGAVGHLRAVGEARRVVEQRVHGRRVVRADRSTNAPPFTERSNVTDVVGVVRRRDRPHLDLAAHALALVRRLERDRRRRDGRAARRRSCACGRRCRARRRGTGPRVPGVDVGDVVEHAVRRVVVGADVLPLAVADLGEERHLVERVCRRRPRRPRAGRGPAGRRVDRRAPAPPWLRGMCFLAR